MDEEDEGSKFCEEDIDQILLRRTHTITIESEGKGSTFAKVRTSRRGRLSTGVTELPGSRALPSAHKAPVNICLVIES